jgi:hypothetical protein
VAEARVGSRRITAVTAPKSPKWRRGLRVPIQYSDRRGWLHGRPANRFNRLDSFSRRYCALGYGHMVGVVAENRRNSLSTGKINA